jgi:hypothetical protein
VAAHPCVARDGVERDLLRQRAGRRRDEAHLVEQELVALQSRGQPPGAVLPLVAEDQVDVAEREERQGLLGLGLEEVQREARRLPRQAHHGRDRDLQRDGLEAGDPRAARHRPRGRGELRLGERRALQQRVRVPDEHERRVREPHAPPGALEQGDADLALERREPLRDGRRGELQRVGHGGDRPALVQLAQQAQSAQVEHRGRSALGRERAQALVLLSAGGAALEVRAHAGDRAVRVAAGELQVDVLVEEVEAVVAADLGPVGAEQPDAVIAGHRVPSTASRSLRRASCSVL